jgi:hypothetical protein
MVKTSDLVYLMLGVVFGVIAWLNVSPTKCGKKPQGRRRENNKRK